MKEFWKEVGRIRGIYAIAAAALIGLVLLMFGGGSDDGKQETADTETTYTVEFYTENMEERVAELCRRVKGVREAYVLLTLEAGSEYVYAENTGTTARDYVILQRSDEESAVLLKEISPRIRGVAVVCTHGDDSAVRLTITELLSAALGIPSSSIRVAGT